MAADRGSRLQGRRVQLLTLGAIMAGWSPAIAKGQSTDQTSADVSAGDIVVTAQKRAERVEDVPIAMSVISGAELEDRNISRFDSLSRIVPNLQFEPGASPNENSFTLRGISAATTGQGLQSSVGVYVDGVYVAGRSSLNFDLFDISRIEVLRGPQGTLFGRNASAGALSIVSGKPQRDLAGRVTAEYGDYNDIHLGAVVGGGFGDSGMFAQVAGSYRKRDGYLTNLFDGSRLQGGESKGGRLYLGYRPDGGAVTIEITGDYSREDNLSGVLSATPYTREVNVNTNPYNNRDVYGLSGTVTIDGGPVEVTAITGFRGFTATRQADNDATPENLQFAVNADEVGSFSQELRFASVGSNPIQWLVGGYYYSEVNRLVSDVALTFGPTLFSGQSTSRLREDSLAVFGQVGWTIAPSLEVTVGGRYSSDGQRDEVTRTGFIPVLLSPGQNVFMTASTDLSLKAAIRYTFAADQNFYATVAQGYKSGGVNVAVLSPANADKQAYLPERAINYEIGYKGVFAQRRLRVSAAAFVIDYRDLQVFRSDPVTFDNFLGNAEKARSYGIEAEVQATLTPRLVVSASGGWTDATYVRYADCSSSAPTACDGNRLNRAPEMTASGRIDYTLPLGLFGLRFAPDVTFTGPTFFDATNEAGSRRAGFLLVNGEIALDGPDRQWSIGIFGKNLTDRDYFTDAIESPLADGGTEWRYGAAPPRTFGVRARAKF